MSTDPRFAGEWPDLRPLVSRELASYLATVASLDPALPTRCPPWTVADVTRHLAATFERFARMTGQARDGDLTPPFTPAELDEENLRAVREFGPDDPAGRLRAAWESYAALAGDQAALVAHQRGPVPAGLQTAFGLTDVAVHHDDVAVAAGGSYTPPDDVVSALVATSRRVGWWDEGDEPTWRSFVGERGA